MFTLGTGVGGGLVYEGKVVRGAFDFGTEIGHMIMVPGGEKCGCGQRGCLERYTSAKYTARRATALLAGSPKLRKSSALGEIYRTKGKVTSADIVTQAQAGDDFALKIWNETCRMLALACINVCHFIDPQMIVLAGGMSQAGKFLLDKVNRHFEAEWWAMTKPTAKIALAKLGNDAGVIGAAGVAKEAEERHVLPPIGR
jgi:glucokinase